MLEEYVNFPDGWKNRNFFWQPVTRSALVGQKSIQLIIFVQSLIHMIEEHVKFYF